MSQGVKGELAGEPEAPWKLADGVSHRSGHKERGRPGRALEFHRPIRGEFHWDRFPVADATG